MKTLTFQSAPIHYINYRKKWTFLSMQCQNVEPRKLSNTIFFGTLFHKDPPLSLCLYSFSQHLGLVLEETLNSHTCPPSPFTHTCNVAYLKHTLQISSSQDKERQFTLFVSFSASVMTAFSNFFPAYCITAGCGDRNCTYYSRCW